MLLTLRRGDYTWSTSTTKPVEPTTTDAHSTWDVSYFL
jgi:hypothetical protein